MLRRHGEGKAVVRFQQHTARLHQRLPDGAVHCLPEVAALGVLEVRAAGEQRHPHVAERRARQHAAVLALQDVRADQALVGRGQVVHMAAGVEGNAAAPRAGGKEQVRLGIVPKRLVVAAAHGGPGDGLAVEHVGRQKARVKAEAVHQQPGEHLDLHRAHHPHGGAGVLRVPCHAQGGVLVLKNAQAFHQPRGRRALRRLHAHGQHGLGRRGRGREAVRAQDIAAAGRGQARRAHHVARARLIGGGEGRAAVEAQLVNLLRAAGEVKGVTRAQRARKHLEKAHALARRVAAHLIDERLGRAVRGRLRQGVAQARDRVQQLAHALPAQRRARKHRERSAPGKERRERVPRVVRGGGPFHTALKKAVVEQGQRVEIRRAVNNGHDLRGKALPEAPERVRQGKARQVRFVEKQERGQAPLRREGEERRGVRVHAGGPVHHQHAQVRRRQRPRRLGGEIDVAGRVDEGEAATLPRKPRLPRKHRDAPLALDGVHVQRGIAVIHAARPAQRPGGKQQLLAQGGLARVHVGHHRKGARRAHLNT